MNRKNFQRLLLMLMVVVVSGLGSVRLRAEEDPRVRILLEEALRLYSEKQYVRALDLFKQVQRISPDNKTAEEYVTSTEQRIMEWENQDGGEKSGTDATWDSLLKNRKKAPEAQQTASDIIAARKSLVERMKNRSTSTSNIVQIQDTKSGLEVTLFHDQLFLPGLQILRDESLPILENVAGLIRDKGDRRVIIHSLAHTNSTDPFLLYPDVAAGENSDPTLPQMKGRGTSMLFTDIEATRSMVLFTYLAQRSMGRQPSVKE